MIAKIFAIAFLVGSTSIPVRAQGTFVYDQSSSIESNPGEFSVTIQTSQPFGQSFTPALNEVGFVRLRIFSFSSAGSLFVNLRENSITGNVLAATSPAAIPSGFTGYVDFFFTSPPPVTPGITYFFQPSVISGAGLSAGSHNGFGYTGGQAFVNGNAVLGHDLWFREGIYIAPEPSACLLTLVGLASLLLKRPVVVD